MELQCSRKSAEALRIAPGARAPRPTALVDGVRRGEGLLYRQTRTECWYAGRSVPTGAGRASSTTGTGSISCMRRNSRSTCSSVRRLTRAAGLVQQTVVGRLVEADDEHLERVVERLGLVSACPRSSGQPLAHVGGGDLVQTLGAKLGYQSRAAVRAVVAPRAGMRSRRCAMERAHGGLHRDAGLVDAGGLRGREPPSAGLPAFGVAKVVAEPSSVGRLIGVHTGVVASHERPPGAGFPRGSHKDLARSEASEASETPNCCHHVVTGRGERRQWRRLWLLLGGGAGWEPPIPRRSHRRLGGRRTRFVPDLSDICAYTWRYGYREHQRAVTQRQRRGR